MSGRQAAERSRTGLGWLVAGLTLVATLGAACGDPGPPLHEAATARATVVDVSAPAGEGEAEASPTRVQPLRANDITDVATLASLMAGDTAGDPAWIPIVAELRAQSWLAARHPEHADLSTIYSDDWLAADSSFLMDELGRLDAWLDRPLPSLVSVTETRTLGQLVEIEVTITGDQGVVRSRLDDEALATVPGGPARGLYVLGPSGPGGAWRIHAVTELTAAEGASP